MTGEERKWAVVLWIPASKPSHSFPSILLASGPPHMYIRPHRVSTMHADLTLSSVPPCCCLSSSPCLPADWVPSGVCTKGKSESFSTRANSSCEIHVVTPAS